MIATWVPAVLTPAKPEHVSRAYRTVLTRLVGSPSDLAVAVLHAHCALETGHMASCYGNNMKNKKAGQKYAGKYQCLPILNERLMRGGELKTVWFSDVAELAFKGGPIVPGTEHPLPPGHPQSRFCAYDSLIGCLEDQLPWLMTERWRPAFQFALDGNPAAYVDAIADRGYFTAPRDAYKRAVVSLTQKYLPVSIATREAEAVPTLQPDSDELCRDMAECHRFELPPDLAARVRLLQDAHVDDALEQARKARDEEIKNG